MNFNFYLVKSFRILLFPFALIYGSIVTIRNYLFDKRIIRSATFNLPLICVGNLSLGGTGKSPMVEYLLNLLHQRYHSATLSRGYKRKTKGYILANAETTAREIGDEPMQFHAKFHNVAVAVGEERLVAIPKLLQDRPETELIILDDAYQHRWIEPGFNILLTEYANLFTRDFFLPTGHLRDQRSSYKRADIIVVTKCPPGISEEEMNTIHNEIRPSLHQNIFFTALQYGQPYHIVTNGKRDISIEDEVLLVCGIANPASLKLYLVEHAKSYYKYSFSDHHIYTSDDLLEIRKRFDQINGRFKMIVTTEKDAVRLIKFHDIIIDLPLYVLPVRHEFLQGRGMQFDNIVNAFVKTFQTNKLV